MPHDFPRPRSSMASTSSTASTSAQASAIAASASSPSAVWLRFVILPAAVLLLVTIAVRTAWMSDDAFITLRTVDNLWHGYGLRWNVIERVQTYTHPLWMLLLAAAYGVTREPYFTTLGLSAVCLIGSVALILRRLPPLQSALTILALAASRAFADFSSSGLENPLSHLLLIAFVFVFLQEDDSPRRFRTLAWLTTLCALTRLDLGVLLAPAMIVEIWRFGPRRALPVIAIAGSPLIAWHLFTLIYYGSLVPNTALAKLNTGVPKAALVTQGLWYLAESLRADFVTLPLTIAGAIVALWRGGRDRLLGLGIAAGLAYVMWVGGDFMSGRFLTAPFVCAVLVLARAVRRPRIAAAVAAALIVAGVVSPRATLRLWAPEPVYDWDRAISAPTNHGVVDERRVYSQYTGLLPILSHRVRLTDHPWAEGGRTFANFAQVKIYPAVGLLGYYSGPAVHVIDFMALGDPFLARLPAQTPWRPGHFERRPPDGYTASVEACVARLYPFHAFVPTDRTCVDVGDEANRVTDPRLRALFADVMLVTQGPVFTGTRWKAISRLNGWSTR